MNKQVIRHYLRAKTLMDAHSEQLIDECIQEVKQIAQFKVVYQLYCLSHQPLMLEEVKLLLDS